MPTRVLLSVNPIVACRRSRLHDSSRLRAQATLLNPKFWVAYINSRRPTSGWATYDAALDVLQKTSLSAVRGDNEI